MLIAPAISSSEEFLRPMFWFTQGGAEHSYLQITVATRKTYWGEVCKQFSYPCLSAFIRGLILILTADGRRLPQIMDRSGTFYSLIPAP